MKTNEENISNVKDKEHGVTDSQLQVKLLKDLVERSSTNRLPVPEPGVFTGDPLKYQEWKCAFSILIERKGIPETEKLYYLKKYLAGEAREVIEGLFYLTSEEEVFMKAKKMLDKRYGDQFVVADAFRKKPDAWPKIQARDGQGLRQFTDFLRQCDAAMPAVEGLRYLNDDKENKKMLNKIP